MVFKKKTKTTAEETIKTLFRTNGFPFFTSGIYNINLFGVRSSNSNPDLFDDLICIACYDEAGFYSTAVNATTNPGITVLKETMATPEGTAILPSSTIKNGTQYKYELGYHKGKYSALVQGEPFTIVRDSDKDSLLLSAKEIEKILNKKGSHTGWFGLNIHHASGVGVSTRVGNWSWGCQVVQSIHEWRKLESIVNRSVGIFGDRITYTLFDERDLGMTIQQFKNLLNS